MKNRILFSVIAVLIFTLMACNLESSEEIMDSPFSAVQIGDTIHFGELDWIVLEIEDGKALIISEKILSQRQWHYEQRLLTWEPSEIRNYLNGSFLEETFSDEEKNLILEANIVNNANLWYASAGAGVDTQDRVFLLSLEEVVKYFGDSGILSRYAGEGASGLPLVFIYDEYNDKRRAEPINDDIISWWWLRTPGRAYNALVDSSAAAVNGIGEIVPYGIYLVAEGGVRPAMWVRMK